MSATGAEGGGEVRVDPRYEVQVEDAHAVLLRYACESDGIEFEALSCEEE